MRLNLRVFLTVAFTLTATVPVIYLALWLERTAMKSEVDSVRDRHLVLAKNMTAALERYAVDIESTLAYLTDLAAASPGRLPEAAQELARKFDIRCLMIAAPAGDALERRFLIDPDRKGPRGASTPQATLLQVARAATADIGFSPVTAGSDGNPAIFVSRALGDGKVVIAELSTDYIRKLQQAITFGAQGHAAVVDHTGRVLAHPNGDWVWNMRDISAVLPVRRMVDGGTGVTAFHSPAVGKNMISGYTVVTGPGWGVMVPQPIDELEARAADLRNVALVVGLAGMVSALVLGWWISGMLSSRLNQIIVATRHMRDGRREGRVGPQPRWAPTEFHEVADAFDVMANEINDDRRVMAAALQDAKKADLAKSDFLANMSHELRTPLNAILGFSSMISKSMIDSGKMVEYARDIYASGTHLLSIINDILDISTIQTGRISLREVETPVSDLIAESVRIVRQQAEDSRVTLEVRVPQNLPPLMVDPVKQRQVLVNLLSNALKFTPAGGRVSVGVTREPDDAIQIVIQDTGIGMSAEEIDTAMKPFGQVETGLTRRQEGTGLGLPLARSFVEMQGGRFTLTSIPGEGTTILILFPASKVQYAAA